MIKFIKNLLSNKSANSDEIIPVPEVDCDGCNDYGYIEITFGGRTAKMTCSKCNGKSITNAVIEQLETDYHKQRKGDINY